MRVLRRSEVARITGLSPDTIRRLERRGQFPARVQIGPSAVGWREDEVRAWVDGLERADATPGQLPTPERVATGSDGAR